MRVSEKEEKDRGPSVSGDKHIDDLAVLVEERKKIICGGTYSKKRALEIERKRCRVENWRGRKGQIRKVMLRTRRE